MTARCLLLLSCLAHFASALAEEPAQPGQPALTVAAAGDIMLGTDFPQNRLADDDGVSLLAEAAPLIRSAGVGFGNLEGVLMDGGEPVKKCADPGACYLFRSPTRYAGHLAAAGFTVMSLANNHARDFGEEGRDASMAALQSAGIHHSGRDGDVASWNSGDLKVAMIAFAPFKGAHDLLSVPAAATRISALAGVHDIVIVSMHAGGEAGDVLHVPFETETYRGENRGDVALFARTAVEAGADLVVGHGPHVPRGIEIHEDRLIAYSLGNFATYYGIRVTGNNGLAPLLVAELDADGSFIGGRIHSFRQRRPKGPVADPSAEAMKLMRDLSLADFPDSAPVFHDDGRISPRLSPATQSSVAD
ncbi:MAG: CapA family protein [Gammaproteobacteria bacterium]|nr:MAG: CapA family protein [Gammaproteobacteria bacterium]